MKKTLCTFLIILLGLVMTGCGETTGTTTTLPDSSTGSTERQPAVISFSWWGTADRNIATFQAIELFESRYPMYDVQAEQAPWSGYQTSLYNKLERDREADVFQVNYNWLYSMDGEAYFLDLNQLGLDLSGYSEGELDPLTVNGKLLGLSLSETGYVFYLNWSVYEAAGITEIPKTWNDLVACGQAIGAASGGKKYAIGRLDAQQVAILMFSYLAQITGKNVISADNRLNFTREELQTGFNFISLLRSNNVLIPSNAADTYTDGPTNPQWVTYQNYGGVLQWNTAISEYQNTLPASGQLVMAGMFQQEEGQQVGMYKKVSMALAVSPRVLQNAAKREAVKTFIAFMTTDPDAVRILGVDRGVPSNQTARSILEASTTPLFTATLEWVGHDVVQSLYDHQLSLGQNLYIHPYYEHDIFRQIYEAPIERFLNGTVTAAQAISTIMNQFDGMLAEVMGE